LNCVGRRSVTKVTSRRMLTGCLNGRLASRIESCPLLSGTSISYLLLGARKYSCDREVGRHALHCRLLLLATPLVLVGWARVGEGHALLVHPNGEVVASPMFSREGCFGRVAAYYRKMSRQFGTGTLTKRTMCPSTLRKPSFMLRNTYGRI
jgi:hypothetical protein